MNGDPNMVESLLKSRELVERCIACSHHFQKISTDNKCQAIGDTEEF
jgi:hypothetical protein